MANQYLNGQSSQKRSQHEWTDFVSLGNSNALAISLQNIRVQYKANQHPVLNIEQLAILSGERVALIGPSGAGKTTLLRLLNGYVQPKSGCMNILGHSIRSHASGKYREQWTRAVRRRVGFVFQDFSLVERATVFQNVLWGRLGLVNPFWSVMGWFAEADKMAAMKAIAEVDLLPQTNQRVDTLSGGQQQRVGVARVLAQEAEVILADEPVSNLDPGLAEDVMHLLSDVSQHHNATLIMSLHQPILARRYADRIIGLCAGEVVYDAPADQLDETAVRTIYGRDVDIEATLAGEQTSVNHWPVSPVFVRAEPWQH